MFALNAHVRSLEISAKERSIEFKLDRERPANVREKYLCLFTVLGHVLNPLY